VREWDFFVCGDGGDYALGGPEEVFHTSNLRRPGRRDLEHVERGPSSRNAS
jgi:hypothetical protein